jgi:glycine dehydrogenase subunit 2
LKSNQRGWIDLEDLRAKMNPSVAGLMLTNPNTLGLFEEEVGEINEIVHNQGGLVYMDGANLNALLGIVRPGDMGFDITHINLHKTFATPHGGGGPGSGAIAVNEKLVEFLPVPRIEKNGDRFSLNYCYPRTIGKVLGFYGNFGVIVRAYCYIRMMGTKGLQAVSRNAILNANYLRQKLSSVFEIPYNRICMHEFVASGERQLQRSGIKTLDIAKRLLDYGFHSPTVYFPLIVKEALMIEPTETESKETLDRFIEALVKIDQEATNEPEKLRNAPWTTPVRRLDELKANKELNICWGK